MDSATDFLDQPSPGSGPASTQGATDFLDAPAKPAGAAGFLDAKPAAPAAPDGTMKLDLTHQAYAGYARTEQDPADTDSLVAGQALRTLTGHTPTGMRVAGPMAGMAAASWLAGPEAGAPMTFLALLLGATGGAAAAEYPAQKTEQALGQRDQLSGADASINIGAGGLAPVVGATGKAALGAMGVRAGTSTAARLAATAAVRGAEGAALTAGQDTATKLAHGEPVTAGGVLKAGAEGAVLGSLLGTGFDELARTQTLQQLRQAAAQMGYKGSGAVDDLRAWWTARQAAAREAGMVNVTPAKPEALPEGARSQDSGGQTEVSTNPAVTPTPEPQPPPANVQTGLADMKQFAPVTIPAGQITTRPDLMQFKRIDEGKSGINAEDKLEGKWDPLKGGLLLLWEPKNPAEYGLSGDQKYIVANGHHRYEFGERVDNPEYHSQILREADGYTAADARRLGAEINIADGKGSIYDQAKFIRNTAATHGADEALAAAGRIGARGRKAAIIGTTAGDSTFDAFINEQITADHAEQIAVAAPGNDAAQRVGVHVALKGASPLEAANTVRAAMADVAGGGGEQGDLFGSDDSALNAMIAQAKVASKIQRGIASDIQSIAGAAKRPEVAAKYGVDIKDPEGLAKKLQELRAQQDRWASWNTDPELAAQVRAEAGLGAQPPGGMAEGPPEDLFGADEMPFNLASTEEKVLPSAIEADAKRRQLAADRAAAMARQRTFDELAAKDYVSGNGTPPEKQADAQRDIQGLLETAANAQLDLFGNLYPVPAAASGGSAGVGPGGVAPGHPMPSGALSQGGGVNPLERAAAALRRPEDPEALKAAFADGDRISSIIPALIRDPLRHWDIRGVKITSPQELAVMTQMLRTPYVETTKVILLNNQNVVVHSEIVGLGTVQQSFLAPNFVASVISRAPKTTGRYRILLSHNHPSGQPNPPSKPDDRMTKQIHEAIEAAGHDLVDHIITNGDTFYSYKEEGMLSVSAIQPDKKPVTGVRPTGMGAQAGGAIPLGTQAPWEVVKRSELKTLSVSDDTRTILNAARQVDPTALHVLYLNMKNGVTALERMSGFTFEQTAELKRRVFEGSGREGAAALILFLPENLPAPESLRVMRQARELARHMSITLHDVMGNFGSGTMSSAHLEGFLEAPDQPAAGDHELREEAPPLNKDEEAVIARDASLVAQDLARLRAIVAPQTLSNPARFAANLLRELNARDALEAARASERLQKYRAEFDRTPLRPSWKFEAGKPLPPNLAFIAAYEGGGVDAVGPGRREVAREFARQNAQWIEQLHALGNGVLQQWMENYFPHMWAEPETAKAVISKLLAKKPLEGSKAFLKERTHRLFVDALAAGLRPLHDNPVDLWLLKRTEVGRFLMGRQFVQQMKALGQMKFVSVFARPPENWVTVDDAAFQVWGPPTVRIWEAYDSGQREKLFEVLKSLGVPHERLVKIGGKRAGYASREPNEAGQPGRIVTKFGGPNSVYFHELGHVLDFRYPGLRVALFGGEQSAVRSARTRAQFHPKTMGPEHTELITRDAELRALADARAGEGKQASESFQKYLRKTVEKMAVVLEAYLHAPGLMQRIAPTIYASFKGWLAAHPELRQIEGIRPTVELGAEGADQDVGGMVKLGAHYMPAEAARVVNNFLKPGLNQWAWYRTLRSGSNFLNSLQLVGAFHAGFTSLDAVASQVSAGIAEGMQTGDVRRAARTFASVPLAMVTNVKRGTALRRAALLTPEELAKRPEEERAMVRALTVGGGRVGQDAFWQTQFTRRMVRAIRLARLQIKEGEWPAAAGSAAAAALRTPFALVEQIMRPVLEWLVPRQKLGVFYDQAARVLRTIPANAPPGAEREAMRKAWDNTEDRMGQVTYDNLFLNKAVKDVALLSFRAFGWQFTKYRAFGGAAVDAGRYARDLAKFAWGRAGGDQTAPAPEWTDRMSYPIALALVVGTIGGVIHYLMTGKRPEARDYFQPQTGETDANGNAVRLNLPTYVKDIAAYSAHPVTSFAHSLNPMLSAAWDLLQNRDFYNTQIHNPADPLGAQARDVAAWGAGELVPFSVSGGLQLRANGAPAWKQIAPWFGVTPVPQRLTMTPAQELASEIIAASMPGEPMTKHQFDAGAMIKDVVRQMKAGNGAAGAGELAGGIQTGELNPDAAHVMIERMKYTPLQFQVHNMTAEAAMRVWAVANPEERGQLGNIIRLKVANSRTIPQAVKVGMIEALSGEAEDRQGTPAGLP